MGFIPVIDFANCGLNANDCLYEANKHEVGNLLFDAFKTSGFAYLKNCGISEADVDQINAVTGEFFEAPLKEKIKYSRKPNNYGYVGLHSENLDPVNPNDFKEAFNVNVGCINDPDTNWPCDLSPQFYTVVKNFMEKCKLLTFQILKVLGVGMKLADTDHFLKSHSLLHQGQENCTALRTIYYPPLPDDVEAGYVRLGVHSDYGSITLLFQDAIGGLQVQNLEGKFVHASPIKGTVLINIGDLLQSWSQNQLKSTKHRVVNLEDPNKKKQVRRSIAYFVHPNNDVVVDQKLIFEGDEKNEFTSVTGMTAYEYLQGKFKQTY